MRAARLNSSMIERVVYDPGARLLTVTFCGGSRYRYAGVPELVYDGLTRAESAGGYFNTRVKGRYPCEPDPAQRRFRPTG